MSGWRVDSIRIGRVGPLGPKGIPSGMAKSGEDRPLRLTHIGFEGDEQGDRRHHGGPEKAVHHYPRDHYAGWAAALGGHALLDEPAAFGENIATIGLTEADVAIGDRFRLGEAIVEVSQGRQPCFRLNLRFERPDIARRMQDSGWTGWYYRVVEEGMVAPGDTLVRLDRTAPEWTIERLRRALYVDVLDGAELRAIVALPVLPERWRKIAEARLRTGAVEDWQARLTGA